MKDSKNNLYPYSGHNLAQTDSVLGRIQPYFICPLIHITRDHTDWATFNGPDSWGSLGPKLGTICSHFNTDISLFFTRNFAWAEATGSAYLVSVLDKKKCYTSVLLKLVSFLGLEIVRDCTTAYWWTSQQILHWDELSTAEGANRSSTMA